MTAPLFEKKIFQTAQTFQNNIPLFKNNDLKYEYVRQKFTSTDDRNKIVVIFRLSWDGKIIRLAMCAFMR